jgi:hypothetical protein
LCAPKKEKKTKKAVGQARRKLECGVAGEPSGQVGEDEVVPATPLTTKRKRFPIVRDKPIDLKEMLRESDRGPTPWVEIVAKKKFLEVKFCYPSKDTLTTRTKKVAYPKPGHALILSDE